MKNIVTAVMVGAVFVGILTIYARTVPSAAVALATRAMQRMALTENAMQTMDALDQAARLGVRCVVAVQTMVYLAAASMPCVAIVVGMHLKARR